MGGAPQTGYRVKGTTLRAYVKYLREHNKLDAVQRRLSPEEAALLAEPPLPGSWLEARVLENLVDAVYSLEGKQATLEMARQVIRDMVPAYVGVLQGVLRIFGASPSLVLPRLNEMMKPTIQGQDYQFTPTGSRSGTVDLRIATARSVPRSAFISPVAAFEYVFSMCNVKGSISEPQVTGPQSARFTLSW